MDIYLVKDATALLTLMSDGRLCKKGKKKVVLKSSHYQT